MASWLADHLLSHQVTFYIHDVTISNQVMYQLCNSIAVTIMALATTGGNKWSV